MTTATEAETENTSLARFSMSPLKMSPYGVSLCVSSFGAVSAFSTCLRVFCRYFSLAAFRSICRCLAGLW
uniref:Uncharacterized protein n=1 Tax=Anopheles dirus TaxID=7168 RepID=A0A182N7U8_9DIPT